MSGTNETVADIVREMRERCISRDHSPCLWPYLERIEEAAAREADKKGGAK